MNALNQIDNWLLDPRNDGLWDLLVLPASAASLLSSKTRIFGALGLALWSSRAVAVHGGKTEQS